MSDTRESWSRYAAAALQALIGNPKFAVEDNAEDAAAYADEMLRLERERFSTRAP